MTDLTPTIIAKSDQMNSEDLIAGPVTIKITKVTFGGGQDQPINIYYDGDNGKPWKPCKTMRRVLVSIWGADGSKYVGQHMTLYCDPAVKWFGAAVGGIRISHMSGMTEKKTMSLTVTRGSKRPYTVEPLNIQSKQQDAPQSKPEPKVGGIVITPDDWLSWTQKMDDALTEDAIKLIGVEISQVASSYDQSSCDKLGAYYKDRIKTIRAQQASE